MWRDECGEPLTDVRFFDRNSIIDSDDIGSKRSRESANTVISDRALHQELKVEELSPRARAFKSWSNARQLRKAQNLAHRVCVAQINAAKTAGVATRAEWLVGELQCEEQCTEEQSLAWAVRLARYEVAAMEESRRHNADPTEPKIDGVLCVDQDGLVAASFRSLHGILSSDVRRVPTGHLSTLSDTGAKTSCISEATVRSLVSQGAIADSDLVRLDQPRYIVGVDKEARPRAVTHAVLLECTFAAAPGYSSIRVTQLFLVVPHLSKGVILGRDLLFRYHRRWWGAPGGKTYMQLSSDPIEEQQGASEVNEQNEISLMTADESKGWQLHLLSELTIPVGRDMHAQVRILDANGEPPSADECNLCQIEVDVPGLRKQTLVVGTEKCFVILQGNNVEDLTLPVGTILGEALPLIAAQDPSVVVEPAQRLRAMDLYCGAGGFSYGAQEHFDVKVAVDNSEKACKVYKRNHPNTKVFRADLQANVTKNRLRGLAEQHDVKVIFGGPPCTHLSMAGKREVLEAEKDILGMIDLAASMRTVEMVIIENVVGVLSAPVYDLALTRAHALGFSSTTLRMNGDDLGLATKRKRVFMVFVRGGHDQAAVLERTRALNLAASLVASARGKAGFSSVREVIGRETTSDFYRLVARNTKTPEIFSFSDPAPCLRSTCLSPAADMSKYRTRPRDATTDTDLLKTAEHLSWHDLKCISSFGDDFDWPEPEIGDKGSYAQMLANAVPPAMADALMQVLQSAGVLKLCLKDRGTGQDLGGGEEIETFDDLEQHISEQCFDTEQTLFSEADAGPVDGINHLETLAQPTARLSDENLNQSNKKQTRREIKKAARRAVLIAAQEATLKETAKQAKSGPKPLAEWDSEDPAIQKVIVDVRNMLPAHILQVVVDLDGFNADQIVRLGALLLHNAGVFSKNKWDIGFCDALPFRVELKPDSKPATQRPYRYSPALSGLVKIEIDRLLAAGIIRPSMSEWASPVVAVLKKDGTARITVNYQKLNAMTVIPQMPLPNIEDLLNGLGGSAVLQ